MEYCCYCNDYTDDYYCSRCEDSCATYDDRYEDSYDQSCQYCFGGASYSDNYCPTCGAAFGTVATVEESSYEVVSYKIKESAEPLIEYADKNCGKAEVSAQVGKRKISATYTQEATEISFTSYTPEIDYGTEDYTPETDSGTVAESSSSISIEKFADTIRKSAEATVEFAELHGGSVKVITQSDGIEIITSYTP
ncbi:hypothetical protein C1646_670375 [Rhizophagus diaphanus]|nr:hypothetical protein C1646_670375 [Rhizophagus diaphanus] [Rhizophagus sp. MUCL 43196]